MGSFEDLKYTSQAFALGEEIAFALGVLDGEKEFTKTHYPDDRMFRICESLADCYRDGKVPTVALLSHICQQIAVVSENYHAQERCQKYVEVARIFVNHEIIRHVNAVLTKYPSLDLTSTGGAYKAFQDKWQSKSAPGWYGVDMGGCPDVWYSILDEIMSYLIEIDESFQIHQIKLKFGGCRWYVDTKVGYYPTVEKLIEDRMFDKTLIY